MEDTQLPIEGKSKKPSSMTNGDWEKLDWTMIASVMYYLVDTLYFHVSQ